MRKINYKRPKYTPNISDEKRFNRFLEETKLTNDYLKHIATLDTGSILIMATFLPKTAKSGAGSLVAVSAFFFILSLVGVIATQGILVRHISENVDNPKRFPSTIEKRFYRSSIGIAYFGFIIGLSILAVFVFSI